MKPDIHPPIYNDAKVTCTACGAVFRIAGTVKQQQIEICSNCHPVYTGRYREATSSGRVARFRKKLAQAEEVKAAAKPKKGKLSEGEKFERKLKEATAKEAEKKKIRMERERARKVRAAKKVVKRAAREAAPAYRTGRLDPARQPKLEERRPERRERREKLERKLKIKRLEKVAKAKKPAKTKKR